MNQLPVPSFFDPTKASQIWQIPYAERAQQAREWANQCSLKPAASDNPRIALMGIDLQNTFCVPTGELFVAGQSGKGAVEDSIRLCQFIYQNLAYLTSIFLTMDTHRAMQIFHQIYWINEQGDHPAPMTIISEQDVATGVWKVNPAIAKSVANGNYLYLQQEAAHYVATLAKGGKYPLIIWPYHAMLGGVGHALVSSVHEAAFFHNIARNSQTGFEIKGGNPLTENYSVLRPEVLQGTTAPIGQKNTRFLQTLMAYDYLFIAGQAASHCVAWTIDDLLTEILAKDPNLAKKVYIIEDCTSPVVVPGVIDFTQQANDALAKFAAAGMHVVRSTTPIDQWDGVSL